MDARKNCDRGPADEKLYGFTNLRRDFIWATKPARASLVNISEQTLILGTDNRKWGNLSASDQRLTGCLFGGACRNRIPGFPEKPYPKNLFTPVDAKLGPWVCGLALSAQAPALGSLLGFSGFVYMQGVLAHG